MKIGVARRSARRTEPSFASRPERSGPPKAKRSGASSSAELYFDIPPSSNAIWIKRRRGANQKGGSIALSGKAKEYREHVKKIVSKNLAAAQVVTTSNETLYKLDFTFYMHGLQQAKWFEFFSRGKRKGERKAKLRYKKVDTDNRLKFLQDWLCKCLGMEDDSFVFEVTGRKVQIDDELDEFVRVRIRRVDRDKYLHAELSDVVATYHAARRGAA